MRVFIAGAYSRYFVFDWLVREREREKECGYTWQGHNLEGISQERKDTRF